MSGTGVVFPVTEQTHVSAVRRAAQTLASRLTFSEVRAGQLALVVTELATNLAKHARGGEMLLRALGPRYGDTQGGVEVLALDKGPGIPDATLSQRDGYSTAGTAGNGLGAVARQAALMEIFTLPSGTAILARVWRETPRAAEAPRYDVGAAHVTKTDETICGDEWAARLQPDRATVIIADGLGHGLGAHEAAIEAVRVFEEAHASDPATVLEDIHPALRSTRGAAVAIATVDPRRGTLKYAGLGNIAGTVLLTGGGRHNLVSMNGTAGLQASRIQEFHYPMPARSILVLHSDGLSTHWDLDGYPGLRSRHPSVIAGVLFRDFSRRRDDATVVVVKERSSNAD
jgi:anti-sigma regulatory factor (Ser/Thr protein kinase)